MKPFEDYSLSSAVTKRCQSSSHANVLYIIMLLTTAVTESMGTKLLRGSLNKKPLVSLL